MQVERHSDKWQGVKPKRYKGAKKKRIIGDSKTVEGAKKQFQTK